MSSPKQLRRLQKDLSKKSPEIINDAEENTENFTEIEGTDVVVPMQVIAIGAEGLDDEVDFKSQCQTNNTGKKSIFTKDKAINFAKTVWETRNCKTNYDKQKKIRLTLRELLIYSVFLVLIMLIALLPTAFLKTHFYSDIVQQYTQPLGSDGSNDFDKIKSQEKMWHYIKNGMLKALYAHGDGVDEAPEGNWKPMVSDNTLVGRPRIRQVRVKPVECYIPEPLRRYHKYCYPHFSPDVEETADIIPDSGLLVNLTTNAWKWRSAQETRDGIVDGVIGTYTSSGYYLDLSLNREKTTSYLSELFDGLWTDETTRAIVIDFTLYNANLNLFCICKILFEKLYTGGVISSADFRPLYLLRQNSFSDHCVFACEIACIFFMLYFVIQEIREMKKLGLAYFRRFWNLLDFMVIALCITCLALSFYRSFITYWTLKPGLTANGSHPEFAHIAFWCLQYNRVLALLVFFAIIKVFKFVSFSETMGQLTATINYAIYDLIGFAIMFTVVFAAFVQAGTLMFGRSSAGFSTFGQTAFGLYRIILGDFDMEEIKAAHVIFGPLYFIIYILFVFFILLNMFLAIIGEAYAKVKENMAKRTNDFKMVAYFRHSLKQFVNKLRHKSRMPLDKVLMSADMGNQKEVTFANWRRAMKQAGYSEIESSFLFNKYDKDGDRILNFMERRKMHEDMSMGTAFDPKGSDDDEEPINAKAKTAEGTRADQLRASMNADLFADPEDCEELNDRIEDAEGGMHMVVEQFCQILGHMQENEKIRRESEKAILHRAI